MQPSEQVGFTGCLARQNRRGRGLKRQSIKGDRYWRSVSVLPPL
jgi:hypothetical protein